MSNIIKLISDFFCTITSRKSTQYLFGLRHGKIPRDLKADQRENEGISLRGEALYLYGQIFQTIRDDMRSEHRTDKEIDDTLWWYTCDAFLNSSKYKRGNQQKQMTQQLMDDVFSPLYQYEILFSLENVKSFRGEIQFGGARIFQIDDNWLDQWLNLDKVKYKDKELHEFCQNFADKTGFLLTEKGAAPGPAANRARNKATTLLEALRSSLSFHRHWHDEQLMFHLSDSYISRQLEDGTTSGAWSRQWEPIATDFASEMEGLDFLNEYRIILEDTSIKKKIKDAFERAVSWISDAVATENFDHKVIFLCSALESVLCTEDDRWKGESLAYRMMTLAVETGNGFIDPGLALRIYNVRSSITHGSKVDVAVKSDYFTLRHIAHDVLRESINLVAKRGFRSIAELTCYLDGSESFQKTADLLDEHAKDSKGAKRIREVMMSKSHDTAARIIARKYKGEYNKVKGADIKLPNITIEVETEDTINDAPRQLQGHQGPVYIAGTSKRAVKKALERVENTTIGVMDKDGNIVKKSKRKKRV